MTINKVASPVFITILFLLIILSAIASQAQNLEKRISIKLKQVTIAEALDEISVKGQVNFSYSSQIIPAKKKITINAKNKTISEILDDILVKNNIEYSTVSGIIVLKPARETKANINQGTPEKQKKHTISGYVKDSESGETMIGATVYVKDRSTGTYTNSYGFWSLTLPEGNYNLVFSYLGYKVVEQNISLFSDIILNQNIEMKNIEIEPVKIVANKSTNDIRSTQTGGLKLTAEMINQLPGFAGNIDIIKSLHTIPGFTTYGDGSSKLYVRGGNSDHNLLLVDEAPVFNPSHLFGFFTAVAPDAIKDIESYKGDFPAGYGGRLASVINIRTKDGNMKKFGMSGSFNPFTSGISAEGPIAKDKCSYYVALRRSNLGWLTFKGSEANDLEIKFNDFNARLNYLINNNNRLYLSFYRGSDNFSAAATAILRTRGISWNNKLASLRWNHIFNNKLFFNSTIYSSSYNYYLYLDKKQNEYWTSSIKNSSLKLDFSYYPNTKNTIKSGISLSSFYSNPGNVYFNDASTQSAIPEISKYYSGEFTIYASNEMKLSKRLLLNYGLRVPVWQNKGPAKVYIFDVNYKVIDTTEYGDNVKYFRICKPEPRVSISYSTGKNSSIKASYNRTTQFIQLLTNSTGPFTSIEVWAPAGPNIKPQFSDQFTLGNYHILKSIYNLNIEAFYRSYKNQIDYKDHANMLFNPLIEGELRFGTAEAYGAEIMIQKAEGIFKGWLSYTWSRVFRQIKDINNNIVFPTSYDRPHNLSLNISYSPSYHWTLSADWFYMTGNPVTTPVGFYYYNNYSIPIYGEKNNDRLPDYHRLDMSVCYKINNKSRKYQHNIVLTLYNAYGRKNPISVNFNKIMNDNGQFVVPSDIDGHYKLVSTTISVAGVIPSLTYNFKF